VEREWEEDAIQHECMNLRARTWNQWIKAREDRRVVSYTDYTSGVFVDHIASREHRSGDQT